MGWVECTLFLGWSGSVHELALLPTDPSIQAPAPHNTYIHIHTYTHTHTETHITNPPPHTHTPSRFLSALAVVAERPDLIKRVLLTQTGPVVGGMYGVRLFIDGRWKVSGAVWVSVVNVVAGVLACLRRAG
jgi:hypothetical protein